jgi:WhiB family redox-sensing transcriptional regulator
MAHDASLDATWHYRAACAGLSLALFYSEDPYTMRSACAVCAACPVRAECLVDAMDTEAAGRIFGVRGGLTAVQRIRLRSSFGGADAPVCS